MALCSIRDRNPTVLFKDTVKLCILHKTANKYRNFSIVCKELLKFEADDYVAEAGFDYVFFLKE